MNYKPGSIAIGPLSPRGPGKHYFHREVLDVPDRVTNAMSRQTLDLADEWKRAANRPGSLDFMQCKSRGIGC
jgi:hypothetical protein